jgi:hypothetical protein
MKKDAEIKCPIDGCDGAFFTQTGLDFHVKNKHNEVKAQPVKKVSEPTKPKPTVPKKDPNVVEVDYDAVAIKAQDDFKAMKKKMRKEHISLKSGQKLSAKQLMKIFKHDPKIKIAKGSERFRAKPWTTKPLSKWIGKDTFKVTSVNEKSNDWVIYSVESKRLKISWKEGPLKGKHIISYPIVIYNG